MTPSELLEALKEYGADIKGINDRFCGDSELYATCFDEFLNEPNIVKLGQTLASEDVEEAFAAAHALKGLSGNLGLTPFFEKDCILVESLREGETENAESEYAAVIWQYNRLKALASQEKLPEKPEPDKPPRRIKKSSVHGKEECEKIDLLADKYSAASGAKSQKRKNSGYRGLMLLVVILVAALFGISYMFCRINISYKELIAGKLSDESSQLSVFSYQLLFLSISIIVIFAAFAAITALIIFRNKKKLYDKKLRARERMFELLTSNAKAVFALYTLGSDKPDYFSPNASEAMGDKFWLLYKEDGVFRLRSDSGNVSNLLRSANEQIASWDGKSLFKSGYILDDYRNPPTYFDFELYPVGEDGMNFVGIARDVTDAHDREEVTKNALLMAERSNDAKSRFLSNMSHDIRTPMNAIINMTNFAMENIDNSKKLAGYLQTIHYSSMHLLRLINDVLDMSRIESGQSNISSEPFNILAELEHQKDIIQPLCDEKEQTLICDFSGVKDIVVCGDSLKVSQILINLLSNAVKFTPKKGAVRFTAEQTPSLREDMVDMRFIVEDNGIGISESNIKKIFEPFGRANDKRISRIEGTGLGLSICKSYANAMGGAISCESEEGEGSIFTVELFFHKCSKEVPEEQRVSADNVSFLGKHCLVAEDNHTNQIIIKTILERLGFITDIVDDGQQCISKFMQSEPGTYDIIYMDIQMPEIDGYQASVALRESSRPDAAEVPIVAMTANVFAEDIEKARIAGMDGFLSKPIITFNLIDETKKAIEKRKKDSAK